MNKLDNQEIKILDDIKTIINKKIMRENFGNHLNLAYKEKSKPYLALNNNNVLGVTYKSELGFFLLIEFLSRDNTSPNLNYDEGVGVCNYSCDYIKFVFDVFSKFKTLSKGRIKISIRDDYPATLENEHLKFIIAPNGDD